MISRFCKIRTYGTEAEEAGVVGTITAFFTMFYPYSVNSHLEEGFPRVQSRIGVDRAGATHRR
jgi:hypothetical protein